MVHLEQPKTLHHRQRLPPWFKRFTAVLLGLLAGWLLLELLLRIAFPLLPYPIQVTLRHVHVTPFGDERILPPQIWQDDANYQFISRANVNDELQYPDPRVSFHVTTKNWLDPDSHVGFRVPSAAWEPRWPVDAVVVGDSFSFCYTEYPDCWVQQLEDNYGMSVVNLSQVATGSTSHLNLLKTFGLPYEPRLVIWQWYGNDFNDDYGLALQRGEIEGQALPPEIIWEPDQPVAKWLHRYSAVYRLADTVLSPAHQRAGVDVYDDVYQVRAGGLDLAFGRSYTLQSSDLSDPKNRFGWQRTQDALLETQALLAEAGVAGLVVVLIPSKEEVYARWTGPFLGEEHLAVLAEGRLRLLDFCRAEGLLCLDTTPQLTAWAGQGEQLYWPQDTHLNELGNRRLAEIVWQFLVQQQLAE